MNSSGNKVKDCGRSGDDEGACTSNLEQNPNSFDLAYPSPGRRADRVVNAPPPLVLQNLECALPGQRAAASSCDVPKERRFHFGSGVNYGEEQDQGESEDDEDDKDELNKNAPKGGKSFKGNEDEGDKMECSDSSDTRQVVSNQRKSHGKLYAIASYKGDETNNEVILAEGEMVQVLDKNPNGWWSVEHNDKVGWVPSNYLHPVLGDQRSTARSAADLAFSCEASHIDCYVDTSF